MLFLCFPVLPRRSSKFILFCTVMAPAIFICGDRAASWIGCTPLIFYWKTYDGIFACLKILTELKLGRERLQWTAFKCDFVRL